MKTAILIGPGARLLKSAFDRATGRIVVRCPGCGATTAVGAVVGVPLHVQLAHRPDCSWLAMIERIEHQGRRGTGHVKH